MATGPMKRVCTLRRMVHQDCIEQPNGAGPGCVFKLVGTQASELRSNTTADKNPGFS